jgi:hypothetical protein
MNNEVRDLDATTGREASALKLLLSGVFSWFTTWGHLIALVLLVASGDYLAAWFAFAAAWFAFEATTYKKANAR